MSLSQKIKIKPTAIQNNPFMLTIIQVSPEKGWGHLEIEWKRTLKAEVFVFVRKQMTTTCPTLFKLTLPEWAVNGNSEDRGGINGNEQDTAWAAHMLFTPFNTFKIIDFHGTPYSLFEQKENPSAYGYVGIAFIEHRNETRCLDWSNPNVSLAVQILGFLGSFRS